MDFDDAVYQAGFVRLATLTAELALRRGNAGEALTQKQQSAGALKEPC